MNKNGISRKPNDVVNKEGTTIIPDQQVNTDQTTHANVVLIGGVVKMDHNVKSKETVGTIKPIFIAPKRNSW